MSIKPINSFLAKTIRITLLGLPALACGSTSVTLQETPRDETLANSQVLNIARPVFGTRLIGQVLPAGALAADAGEQLLLGMDKGGACRLAPGNSTFIIDLGNLRNIDRLALRSLSATGSVSMDGAAISTTTGAGDWTELVAQATLQPGAALDQDFAFASIRYLRLRFTLAAEGTVSNLTVTGDDTVPQAVSAITTTTQDIYSQPAEAAAQTVPFDFATPYTGARISHVSSGSAQNAQAMVDDDQSTFYTFASTDREHILLLDIAAAYLVRRLSLSMQAGPGLLQLYNLHTLPDFLAGETGADAAGRIIDVPAAYLAGLVPFAERRFIGVVNQTQVDFQELRARWLLIRWTPAPDDAADDPASPVADSMADHALRIYEISLIGDVPEEFAAVHLVPRAEFLATAGSSLIGPTVAPEQPPPTLPLLEVISP
jgi:hypothetical protein